MNALRSSLKGFFAYAHEAGYIALNPARLVRRASTGPRPPRGMSQAEQERLLAAFDAVDTDEARRDAVLVRLMLATGIRLSSALALDVEDVDLERGEVCVRRVKNGGEQVVFIGADTRALLASYLACRPSGPLFICASRRRLGTRQVQRRIAQWMGHAGIAGHYSSHSLRHSFAMGLLARTHDVLLVKAALGHRAIGSTLVHCRADQARLRAAMAG